MIKLQAPHPTPQTTTYLPNPRLGDSDAGTGTVDVKRSMKGRTWTYVKSRDARRQFKMTFRLTYQKWMELRAFVESYHSDEILVTDHLGAKWVVNLVINPLESNTIGRAANGLGGSMVEATLEMQGKSNA